MIQTCPILPLRLISAGRTKKKQNLMDTQPENFIVRTILDAISEQRLPAGSKLGEQALSDLFNCNRANVRRALVTLEAKYVVELRPNRGAFVVAPSPQEAREVFQARRAIERTIAKQAIIRVTDDDIAYLHDNIAAEAMAREKHDKMTELKTSQQFHMYIAQLSGNRILERFLEELTMRSTLILGMYSNKINSCSNCDDHRGIVEALKERDEARLLQLTDEHLLHLEAELDVGLPSSMTKSLKEQLFGSPA